MNELATVLDDLAAGALVDRASWNDVVARARRVPRQRRARKRLVLALAAAVVLALAGTAVGVGINLLKQQEEFHASPDNPNRIGPLVQVASGDDWALIAWQSKVGICLDFAIPGNSPFSCGFPVRGNTRSEESGAGPATHSVAGFVSGAGLAGGDGKTTIFGVAARDVATVEVELQDGRIVAAPLIDAPPALDAPLRFFIVRLRLPPPEVHDQGPTRPARGLPPVVEDTVHAYSAFDGEGRLIERVES
jgi:hypothetical protein